MDLNKYRHIDIKLSPDELRDLKRGVESTIKNLRATGESYSDTHVKKILDDKIVELEALGHRLGGIMADKGVSD